jgi:hypothetical protein
LNKREKELQVMARLDSLWLLDQVDAMLVLKI